MPPDVAAQSTYEAYLDSEWLRFSQDPTRGDLLLDAVRGERVRRVLDVGCGAGQELMPFARDGAVGVGVDVDPSSGRYGRRLYGRHFPEARVTFLTAQAERLPFQTGTFDVVICRVALPYTDNARALSEMARTLRPGGLLLLKIQHHLFYVGEAIAGIRKGSVLPAVHAARVLAAGAWYHMTGRQPRWPSAETSQSESLLRRELSGMGLSIVRRLPDWNPETPSFVIRKA